MRGQSHRVCLFTLFWRCRCLLNQAALLDHCLQIAAALTRQRSAWWWATGRNDDRLARIGTGHVLIWISNAIFHHVKKRIPRGDAWVNDHRIILTIYQPLLAYAILSAITCQFASVVVESWILAYGIRYENSNRPYGEICQAYSWRGLDLIKIIRRRRCCYLWNIVFLLLWRYLKSNQSSIIGPKIFLITIISQPYLYYAYWKWPSAYPEV